MTLKGIVELGLLLLLVQVYEHAALFTMNIAFGFTIMSWNWFITFASLGI